MDLVLPEANDSHDDALQLNVDIDASIDMDDDIDERILEQE